MLGAVVKRCQGSSSAISCTVLSVSWMAISYAISMMWCLSCSKEEHAHFDSDVWRSSLHQGVCCVFHAYQWFSMYIMYMNAVYANYVWVIYICTDIYLSMYAVCRFFCVYIYICDSVHVCMNLSECMSGRNPWMKRCMCGCFCMIIIFMQIPEDSSVAGWVITFVWLCMTVWIILHNEWISCEWNIIICEWLCAFDSVTMIRLCMVLAGWLSDCMLLFLHVTSCLIIFIYVTECGNLRLVL